MVRRSRRQLTAALAALMTTSLGTSLGTSSASSDAMQKRAIWPAPERKTPDAAPALSAEEERGTIVVPPGYRVVRGTQEPLVVHPIASHFDPRGRLWFLEMPGFIPDPSGHDSREPVDDVAVLE